MRVIDSPSPNHNPRGCGVDMLILHYTGMKNAEDALVRLCDPQAKVSAHYLIAENGDVFGLVPEELRAWHAGESIWRGRSDINSASIGVELANPGHEFGYRDFPAAQMEALASLARKILAHYAIPPRHVLGHSDIAIGRKRDPGERFSWQWLAAQGVGLWPDFERLATPGDFAALQKNLAAFGYDCPRSGTLDEATCAAVRAFQLHFRQERCDGEADEETRRRVAILARAV
jgi:N-acetylmuramoyl-L-alanine amidase